MFERLCSVCLADGTCIQGEQVLGVLVDRLGQFQGELAFRNHSTFSQGLEKNGLFRGSFCLEELALC